MCMRKSFLLLIYTLFFCSTTLSKVDPPNYNFSIDTLKLFYPGAKLGQIKKKYPKFEKVKSDGSLLKVYVSHHRYRFPVFFTIHKDIVTSFFARLPTYFLHDVFHQSLINRYGKQDRYKKVNGSALYFWNNEKGIRFVYKGECTITCFPSYLTGQFVTPPDGAPDITLLKKILVF